MRHLRIVVVVLGLLWAASCSSTSNTTTNPQPTRNTEKFSVSAEEGSGTFNPVLEVKESGDTTVVTVTAQDATDLSEALLHLNYNDGKYTPVKVQFGDFLGTENQVITLAVTDKAGEVPLGVVQTTVGGAMPKDGTGVIATVTFNNAPFTGGRAASSFPSGTGNKVADLKIVGQNGSDVDLQWTERNKGDYDNNGIVGLSDLSPLGKYLGTSVASAADPIHMGIIDGDSNGEITVSDLTTIGANLGNQVTGYELYSDATGTAQIAFVARPGSVDPKRPVQYNYTASMSGGEQFVVRGVGSAPTETGMESNVAEITVVPGPPDAPTALITTANASIGSLKVRLNWTASASADVKGYTVQRKLTADPVTSFVDITVSPVPATQYTDQTGLTDADYDYRVYAVDQTDEVSVDPSNTALGHPYIQVISPPLNVVATTDSGPAGVHISWDEPLDGSAERYTVFQKGPGDSSFTELGSTINSTVKEWTASGLQEFQSYEFYVVSRDVFLTLSSVESNHVSADASAALVLDVTSVTTDKTTHYKGGGEPVSNIAATANTPSATWSWSASQGSVTGSGANVTWTPPGGATPGKVTITATAHFGAQTKSKDVILYVTSETIKTTYSMGGAPADSGNIANNGHFIDFERPMVEHPSAPYKHMSDWIDGDHVVLYNMWEIWCPPCRDEMDMMYEWATDYEADKYWHVGHCSTYSLADVTTWLSTPGVSPAPPQDTRPWNDKFHVFCQSSAGTQQQWAGDMPLWQQIWTGYGAPGMSMSLPRTQLYDKDGNCRRWSSTISDGDDTSWRNLIKELTGAS